MDYEAWAARADYDEGMAANASYAAHNAQQIFAHHRQHPGRPAHHAPSPSVFLRLTPLDSPFTAGSDIPLPPVRMLKYALIGQLQLNLAFENHDIRRRQEILILNVRNISRWVANHPGFLAGEYRHHVTRLLHMVYVIVDPPCGSRPFSVNTIRQRQLSVRDVVNDFARRNGMRWEVDGTPLYDPPFDNAETPEESSTRSLNTDTDGLASRSSHRTSSPPEPPLMSGANGDDTFNDHIIDDPHAAKSQHQANGHHRGRRHRANAVSSHSHDDDLPLSSETNRNDSRETRLAAVTGLLDRLFAVLDSLATDASNRSGNDGVDGDGHDDEGERIACGLARVAAVLDSAFVRDAEAGERSRGHGVSGNGSGHGADHDGVNGGHRGQRHRANGVTSSHHDDYDERVADGAGGSRDRRRASLLRSYERFSASFERVLAHELGHGHGVNGHGANGVNGDRGRRLAHFLSSYEDEPLVIGLSRVHRVNGHSVNGIDGIDGRHDSGLANGDHGTNSGDSDDTDGVITPESGQSAQSPLYEPDESLGDGHGRLTNGVNGATNTLTDAWDEAHRMRV